MANGINLWIGTGNLGDDPAVRCSQNGLSIMGFRMGCNEARKKGDGWETITEWISVTVFGRRAEGLAKFLEKGMAVTVTGKIHNSSYEDRDGIKRYRTEIIANDVVVHGKRAGSGGGSKSSRSAPDQGPPDDGFGEPDYGGAGGGDDDSIPF